MRQILGVPTCVGHWLQGMGRGSVCEQQYWGPGPGGPRWCQEEARFRGCVGKEASFVFQKDLFVYCSWTVLKPTTRTEWSGGTGLGLSSTSHLSAPPYPTPAPRLLSAWACDGVLGRGRPLSVFPPEGLGSPTLREALGGVGLCPASLSGSPAPGSVSWAQGAPVNIGEGFRAGGW